MFLHLVNGSEDLFVLPGSATVLLPFMYSCPPNKQHTFLLSSGWPHSEQNQHDLPLQSSVTSGRVIRIFTLLVISNRTYLPVLNLGCFQLGTVVGHISFLHTTHRRLYNTSNRTDNFYRRCIH